MTEIRIFKSDRDVLFRTHMMITAITRQLYEDGFAIVPTIQGDTLVLPKNETTVLSNLEGNNNE